jgi:methionyl-tRNA formyltransferase
MKIVFMGTPQFAVPSLQALIEAGHEIVGVVTSTDKWGGRGGKELLCSDVKQFAQSKGLRILQPEKLKDPEFIQTLRSLQADLQVVVAFRMLPEVVWSMPRLGTLNLHGSLLPRYRGAAPLNWAIIKGEKETGLTTFLLQHEIDTGDILLQYKTPIGENETVGELHDRLMYAGGELVVQTVALLEKGQIQPQPQDNSLACPAPKIFHENCQIDWRQSAQEVHNFIRGLSPYPTAWTMLDGQKLKIFRSQILHEEPSSTPGSFVFGKKEVKVACGQGWLSLLEVQPEKRKRMSIVDFLNGQQRL